MGVLSDLEPKEVFRYFEEICRIPHGSGHTRQISDYLVRFAGEHALRFRQDEKGNVIIWKDGTDGNTDAPAVMLQGHMDMVCEKDPGSGIINFFPKYFFLFFLLFHLFFPFNFFYFFI